MYQNSYDDVNMNQFYSKFSLNFFVLLKFHAGQFMPHVYTVMEGAILKSLKVVDIVCN